jgi:hypothetical protein
MGVELDVSGIFACTMLTDLLSVVKKGAKVMSASTAAAGEAAGSKVGDFKYLQKTHRLEDVAGMAQAMEDDGFVLIPNVLSSQEVADLRAGIDRLQPFGFDKMGKTDHFKCVFNRERLFLNYIDRAGVVDLAEATMGAQCHIIGQSAWRSYPGHDGWAPHTDRVMVEMPEEMRTDARVKYPIFVCTAHYYLNDITLDLAPTWVVPGSHKSGRSLNWGKDPNPEFNGRKLEPVLCKAGDVLFFRSEIWHTGSKNATADTTRYLLQTHYSHRFIAQQFSPFLTWQFNQEILAVANPRQRRLLGEHPMMAYD